MPVTGSLARHAWKTIFRSIWNNFKRLFGMNISKDQIYTIVYIFFFIPRLILCSNVSILAMNETWALNTGLLLDRQILFPLGHNPFKILQENFSMVYIQGQS